MPIIEVRTSRGEYQVRIGGGLLQQAGEIFRTVAPGAKAAIVSDSNVEPIYGGALRASLEAAGIRHCTYVFPAGEASKTLNTVASIMDFLAENRITRSDAVIALGGGVTGDLAGFAAAIYLRGIKVIQIPTSFLAAIDSSVGGKTGVDLPAGKNLAGAFWQPSAVICDPDVLQTLPGEYFDDGTAEALKYGVIADEELFGMIASGCTGETLSDIIARCVAIKAEIVGRDEFDRGERALLNLGHTIGHAVEKCSSFTISHGRGVAIGMAMIARSAEAQGWCATGTADKITRALEACRLPVTSPFAVDELLKYMINDKKRSGADITLVIPETIGRCALRTVPANALAQLLTPSKGAAHV